MYQWLLFDADNTLFDFNKAEAKSFRLTCAHFGIPFTPRVMAQYKAINHDTWSRFERGEFSANGINQYRFGTLFEAIGHRGDPDEFGAHYLVELGNCPDLLEGAEQVVEALAPHFKLGIVTNGLTAVQTARFACASITRYFNPIIISEQVGVKKPEPAIFDAAFAKMGYPDKRNVLMIGDSLSSDILGGVNYGIDTCWVNPLLKPNAKNLPITYEIIAITELPTLLIPTCET